MAMAESLFEPARLGAIEIKNRVVMAPMTRGRAENDGLIPTPLMAEYYAQRAEAGLIISEATWPSADSVSFLNVPGLFTRDQTKGWANVVEAVHTAGGRIFSQLGHTGGVSHPFYRNGEPPLAPSAVDLREKTFIPSGFVDVPVPREMTLDDIRRTIRDFGLASANAKAAGFDGIEIHAAHTYLFPEFLHTATNLRNDDYGGSIENRSRALFEVIEEVLSVWGAGRVSVKLSPGVRSGLVSANEDNAETYGYVFQKLNEYPLAFVHALAFPDAPEGTPAHEFEDLPTWVRQFYKGQMIVGGGYDKEKAQAALDAGLVDAVAFGAAFISNPDLVSRLKMSYPLAPANPELFYTGGANGYTDYPRYA
ncbi:alkene reductase [Roseixanthobacter glucoisosaccharinicivorans]|uniref:alkene reductase n=1 Tax=Roseixanthobacter glucoisosaccharinicivorans TaxID=3119923 RepID=UPI003729104E